MRSSNQIPFGLLHGEPKHVSEVPRGLACGCTCPGCGAPLVARKGPTKSDHFAHYSGASCEGALESALHLAAKKVISQAAEITLPTLRAVYQGSGLHDQLSHTRFGAKPFALRAVREEVSLEDMRPDLIATLEAGHDLLIEIAVTHFVDTEKRAKIRRRGIAAIEIDLSRLDRHTDWAALRKAVLSGKRTEWIFSPWKEAKTAELKQEYLRRRAAEEQAEIERERQIHQSEARILSAYNQLMRSPSKAASEEPINPLIDHPIRGEQLFRCARSVWQARALRILARFDSVSADTLLDDFYHRGYVEPMAWELHQWNNTGPRLADRLSEITVTPASVVSSYLQYLRQNHLLSMENSHGSISGVLFSIDTAYYRPASTADLVFVCQHLVWEKHARDSLIRRYFERQRSRLTDLAGRLRPIEPFHRRLASLSRSLYNRRSVHRHQRRLDKQVSRLNTLFNRYYSEKDQISRAHRVCASISAGRPTAVGKVLAQRLNQLERLHGELDSSGRQGTICAACTHTFWRSGDLAQTRCPECQSGRVMGHRMAVKSVPTLRKPTPLV